MKVHDESMKCLVVSSHPVSESLCMRLTRRVVRRLGDLGHEVILEDLYAQNFQPVLTKQERSTYYQNPYDASAVAGEVDRLLGAEALILVFPTWWFGFPAILKGWFDRVWGPGIAYDHANDFGPITPRLEKLKIAGGGHLPGRPLVGGSSDHAPAGKKGSEAGPAGRMCEKEQIEIPFAVQE